MRKAIITPPITAQLTRQSNFELLRLLSQFYIVLYHTLAFEVYPYNGHIFLKAIQLPLHVGVPLFVLISGYFGIRPTSKGLVKLLGIFLVYSIPEIGYKLYTAESIRESVSALFFLSNTHFWFIKTYLFLFLAAPMLNLWIEKSSKRQQWYMLSVLAFVSIYMGTTGGDETMQTGKNLVNFTLWYLIGNQIRTNENSRHINAITLVALYVALNVALVSGYMLFEGGWGAKAIWNLSFAYSSPVLLINAIILFLIFGKLDFRSKTVNWLAASSLAIYLIHSNRPLAVGLRTQAALLLNSQIANVYLLSFACSLVSIGVMCVCILIDKCLSPIWAGIRTASERVYKKLGF